MVEVTSPSWIDTTHVGDCRALMRRMIADGVRVQCVVTSPPYWGLRTFGMDGQYGLERTWQRHVARMRSTFRLVRELLADDGVLWLNYGDSYSPDGDGANRRRQHGLKPKDMVGMPWRVALGLQDDGWYLRSEVIWAKPNPMPESVTDRPTKSHEHIFLLTKSARYFYDAAAIREPANGNAHARGGGVNPKARTKVAGWAQGPGDHDMLKHAAKDAGRITQGLKDSTKFGRGPGFRNKQNESFSAAVNELVDERNVRTVWSIPTEAFNAAHFATFPRALVRRCVLAGSRSGDVIFDPFMGSGTVAQVATELGRRFIGCELNPEYVAMHGLRTTTTGFSF